jgi:hypothetical protein
MAGAEPPGCVFIPPGTDTSPTGPGDTRRFRVGEPVCMRGEFDPRMGVYVRPLPIPNGRVFSHAIRSPEYPNDRHVRFRDIGKIVPTLGPQLVVEQVGRAFPIVDPDSVSHIARFVGARDPGRFARDDYANVPAPHGVSARRPRPPGGSAINAVRALKEGVQGNPAGGRTRRRRTIRMKKSEYLREHHHLFKVLKNPTRRALKAELRKQQRELRERGLK